MKFLTTLAVVATALTIGVTGVAASRTATSRSSSSRRGPTGTSPSSA